MESREFYWRGVLWRAEIFEMAKGEGGEDEQIFVWWGEDSPPVRKTLHSIVFFVLFWLDNTAKFVKLISWKKIFVQNLSFFNRFALTPYPIIRQILLKNLKVICQWSLISKQFQNFCQKYLCKSSLGLILLPNLPKYLCPLIIHKLVQIYTLLKKFQTVLTIIQFNHFKNYVQQARKNTHFY